MIFPDFSRSAALGFEQGTQMAEGQNPLGQFIKTMLADWQQRRQLQSELTAKLGTEMAGAKYKQTLEEESELGKAKTGISKIQLGIMQEAKKRYDEGDRSPEVLKALDMYATPNVFTMIGDLSGNNSIDNIIPNKQSKSEELPKYNPKTQKLMYSPSQKKYFAVSK